MQHVWRDISTWFWADCTLPFSVTLVEFYTAASLTKHFMFIFKVMSTTQRNNCATSKRCWRTSSCLCLRLQSTPAAIQSCTSSFSMYEVSPLYLWISKVISQLISQFSFSSFMDLLLVSHAGCGFWQCGWWVKTRATYLQPGQSTASQLDRGGQPTLLLLPLLYVCKHDCAEPPAQVCNHHLVHLAARNCSAYNKSERNRGRCVFSFQAAGVSHTGAAPSLRGGGANPSPGVWLHAVREHIPRAAA